MNRVTLNNHELQSFINMSEQQISKKGRKTVINKLNSMGMENISVDGRGKKAIYTFDLPTRFSDILVIPKSNLPSYSAVDVDCMDILINGNVKDELVLFYKEMIDGIANKHGAEYSAVKTTFNRIKSHLDDCGLLCTGKEKSHRVMINGEWITGNKALYYDKEARAIWKRFYDRQRGKTW